MLKYASQFSDRIKFSFECNANIAVNIDEPTIDSDAMIMGHLIFNLQFESFSLTTLALFALSNFQNRMIDEFAGIDAEFREITLKNIEDDELANTEDHLFKEYATSLAFSNPDYKNQLEMIYDVPMIEYKLKRDLFAKTCKISVDKDEIEPYIFVDEKMGIGSKLEIIAENLGTKGKLSSSSKKNMRELIKICEGSDKRLRRGVYRDLRKIINAVSGEMINDKNKTIGDMIFITPNLKVHELFHLIKLGEIYRVFELLEYRLYDIILDDNLSPVYKAEISPKDRNIRKLLEKFRDIEGKYEKYKIRLIEVLNVFVLRLMESFSDNFASMTVIEMIEYSEVGDTYMALGEKRKIKKVIEYLNKVPLSQLEAVYRHLLKDVHGMFKEKKMKSQEDSQEE